MGHKVCVRAHLLTKVSKFVSKVRSTDYALFLYWTAVFHPRRPASEIRNLEVLIEHKIIGGAAKTKFRGGARRDLGRVREYGLNIA